MTTDFPTAPSAYGLNGPSATVTVEKSIHASHTEILTTPGYALRITHSARTSTEYPINIFAQLDAHNYWCFIFRAGTLTFTLKAI